ncbi:MAG: hypothetical protein ACKO86_25140, partial [Dolichospermum sp.]
LFNTPLFDKPIESVGELTTNDPGGEIFLNFIRQIPEYLAPQGEVFFSYSTIGNLNALNKIPSNFVVEKIVEEHYAETDKKYLFRLTMN